MTLRLATELREELVAAARDARPREACGLLVGGPSEGVTVVRRVVRTTNAAQAVDAFEIDPVEFLGVDAEARRHGLEVVGVWHSHPAGPALPSRRDRAAAWPEHVQAIVEPDSGHIRAWRLVDGAFVEDDVVR
ncbi:MAG: M67 family metallopeptidase [Planctomycetes bacterium]|nr:M67 family metallopeptidase [Planctomycetota bacterium]